MGAGLSVLRRLGLVVSSWLSLTFMAFAQEADPWYMGQSKTENGQIRYFAARYADNLIPSGDETPDYAPLYIISCLEHDEVRWQQVLELQDKLTAAGNVMITEQIDNQAEQRVLWVVDGKRQKLIRTNRADISVLRRASRLTLEWNWGWSWVWLSDEATINLSDVSSAIYTLSKQCAISEP